MDTGLAQIPQHNSNFPWNPSATRTAQEVSEAGREQHSLVVSISPGFLVVCIILQDGVHILLGREVEELQMQIRINASLSYSCRPGS